MTTIKKPQPTPPSHTNMNKQHTDDNYNDTINNDDSLLNSLHNMSLNDFTDDDNNDIDVDAELLRLEQHPSLKNNKSTQQQNFISDIEQQMKSMQQEEQLLLSNISNIQNDISFNEIDNDYKDSNNNNDNQQQYTESDAELDALQDDDNDNVIDTIEHIDDNSDSKHNTVDSDQSNHDQSNQQLTNNTIHHIDKQSPPPPLPPPRIKQLQQQYNNDNIDSIQQQQQSNTSQLNNFNNDNINNKPNRYIHTQTTDSITTVPIQSSSNVSQKQQTTQKQQQQPLTLVQRTINELEQRKIQYRNQAILYKSNNNTTEALNMLRIIKLIDQRIEKLNNNDTDPTLLDLRNLPDIDNINTSNTIVDYTIQHNTQQNNNQTISTTTDVKTILLERIKEYQIAYNNVKQANDNGQLKQLTLNIKKLKQLFDNYKNNETIDINDIPLSLSIQPSYTAQNNYTQPTTTTKTQSQIHNIITNNSTTLSVRDKLEYETLLNNLQKQATGLARLRDITIKNTDKNNKTAQLIALQYHRLYKETITNYQLCKTAYNKQYPLPIYSTDELQLNSERRYDNIPIDILQVDVKKLIDLNNNDIGNNQSLNPYLIIQFILNENNIQTITTHTYKLHNNSNSNNEWLLQDYDSIYNFKLGQRTVSLTKRLSSIKLNITVMHKRRLFSDLEIGSGSINIKNLLNQCESNEIIKIKQSNTNHKVGEIYIILRITFPLSAHPDMQKMPFEYIKIDEFKEPSDTVQHQQQDTTQTAWQVNDSIKQIIHNNNDNNNVSNSSKSQQIKPLSLTISSSTQNISTNNNNNDSTSQIMKSASADTIQSTNTTNNNNNTTTTTTTDDIAIKVIEICKESNIPYLSINDPYDIMSIVSNDVYEYEIEQMKQQINSTKQHDDELTSRLQTAEVQLQLLVIAVQKEQLTLDMYINRLNAAIKRDTLIAIQLNKLGKKQDALQLMKHIKIMKQEIETASQANNDNEG